MTMPISFTRVPRTLPSRAFLVSLVLAIITWAPHDQVEASYPEIQISETVFREPIDLRYWREHPRVGIDLERPEWWTDSLRNLYHAGEAESLWVSGDLKLIQSYFLNRVNFSNMIIRGGAYFFRADSELTIFADRVEFRNSVVLGETRIGVFPMDPRNPDHSQNTFDSAADFSRSRFLGGFSSELACFGDSVRFQEVEFGPLVDFSGARFRSYVNFEGATTAEAGFGGCIFEANVNFRNVRFAEKAYFSNCRFASGVDFTNATMPEMMDMTGISIEGSSIDLSFVKPPAPGKKTLLKLASPDANKLRLNMNVFQLHFDSGWTNDQRSALYETVLNKLKTDGFTESYQILDVEYQSWKLRNLWLGRVWDWFACAWWYYGYRPWLVLAWAVFCWVAFAYLLVYRNFRVINENVYRIGFLQSTRAVPTIRALAYTGIVFFGIKMDSDRFQPGAVHNHRALFVWLWIAYVLGLVHVGFLVNWVFRQKRSPLPVWVGS